MTPKTIMLDYTNWRGERRVRAVIPQAMWFGSTIHHPDLQWFMQGLDVARSELRDFALKDVHMIAPAHEFTPTDEMSDPTWHDVFDRDAKIKTLEAEVERQKEHIKALEMQFHKLVAVIL